MNFEPGQQVYDIHGRAAGYIARAAGGHVVEPLYDVGEESEPRYSSAETWREVFATPPVARLHSEIAELEARAQTARRDLGALRAERRAFDADDRAIKERMRVHAALRNVEDYLAGKFTLFVRFHSYNAPAIEDAAKALEYREESGWRERAAGQKLLVLLGDSSGNLSWRMNQYRDGSGSSWEEVIPVDSEAEGIEEIRKRYLVEVQEWRARPDDRKHYGAAISWLKLPHDWINPPQDVLDYVKARQRFAAAAALAKARAELAAAEQNVAGLAEGAA